MGMEAVLIMWPGSLNKILFPHPKEDVHEIWLWLRQVLSEEKIFENVDNGKSDWPWTKVKEWPWPQAHAYLYVVI